MFKFHGNWLWACQYGCYAPDDYDRTKWVKAYFKAYAHMKKFHIDP